MQEYEMAGEFTWQSRLKSSIYRHIRGFILIGIAGIIGIIYVLVKGLFTFSSGLVFLVVLSNCWGLFLIIVLLGYGLVEIPRTFWTAGNNSKRLCNLYIKSTVLSEGIIETKYELDETVKLVNAASYKLSEKKELQSHMNYMLSLCPIETLEHHRAMKTHTSKDAANQLGDINEDTLIKLHKDLKDNVSEFQRSKYRWDSLVEEALELEDIITAANSPFKRVSFTFKQSKNGLCARNLELWQWFWLTKLKPLLFRILAILFFVMSFLTFIGEITLFLDVPVGVFPLIFKSDHGIVLTQFYCVMPLAYIILCTYFGLFNLKLSGWYGLYPNNHTDSSNLVWSAFFLARLSAPLCYNFLLFLKIKNTVYANVMGLIDLVPIVGSQFSAFFPMLLIVFCGLNLCNAYGRAMSAIGMSQFSFSDRYLADKVSEGKILITRERTEREKNNMVYNRNNGNLELAKKNTRKDEFRRGVV